jgi:hypothetical protein
MVEETESQVKEETHEEQGELDKTNATTAKPGSPLSAWYLGGPDEGGTASATIMLPSTS